MATLFGKPQSDRLSENVYHVIIPPASGPRVVFAPICCWRSGWREGELGHAAAPDNETNSNGPSDIVALRRFHCLGSGSTPANVQAFCGSTKTRPATAQGTLLPRSAGFSVTITDDALQLDADSGQTGQAIEKVRVQP